MTRRGSGIRIVVLLVLLLAPAKAVAELDTVYFEHEDERYLEPSQRQGGAVLVPSGARSGLLPMLVFLHGTNPSRALHFWLGGAGRDLRPMATRLLSSKRIRPFLFAGPSQTLSAAQGRNLWTHFDLDRFVRDVDQALDGQASVDQRTVIVVGHSGAGCNARGGLATDFWSSGKIAPRSLVSIDPCLDADLGAALARRPSSVPLWLMWQSKVWPRQVAAFQRALSMHGAPGRNDRIEHVDVPGPTPHDTILPLALERAVRELFAIPRDREGAS